MAATKSFGVILLAVVLTATACSSTNKQSGVVTTDRNGRGVVAGAPEGSDGSVGAAGDRGGSRGGSARGVDGSGVEGGDITASGSSGSRGVAGPLTGRGFTAKTIKLGVHILDEESVNATAVAFGIRTGGETLRTTDWINAVVKYVNATGGIAGRKVETVIVKLDATRSAGAQAEGDEVAACERMTEDEKVFAAAAIGPTRFAFTECMAKKKTAVILDNYNMVTEASFRRVEPFLYFPAGPTADRAMRTVVEGLRAAGYFGTKPKIGVVHPGTGEFPAMIALLRKALAARGYKIDEESDLQSATDAQGYASTVLRFKSEDVTHVLPFGPLATQLFMQTADGQQYYPRYGLSSNNAPASVQINATERQLRGALAVGWVTSGDTDAQHRSRLNTADAHCLDVIRSDGIKPPAGAGQLTALWVCDVFFFLRASLARAPTISATGIARAVDGLGSAYSPAGTWAGEFKPGRRAGARDYRPLRYDSPCRCFVYAGGARRMS
jgi:hypothetical protein